MPGQIAIRTLSSRGMRNSSGTCLHLPVSHEKKDNVYLAAVLELQLIQDQSTLPLQCLAVHEATTCRLLTIAHYY